jgi:multidrug efflux pump
MALIFTPALCATILKPGSADHKTTGLAGWFNRKFDSGTLHYSNSVGHVIAKRNLFLVIYLLLVVATGYLFTRVPTSFLPDEDQGVMMMQTTLPANASSERTQQVLDDIQSWLLKNEPEVSSVSHRTASASPGAGKTPRCPLCC